MKFISRHSKLQVVIRPTIKQVVNNQSGSEEVVKHPPVIVEFRNGVFDTARWEEYTNSELPDKINIIKSEKDLISQLKSSPYFNADFTEMKVESTADRRARLLSELHKLDDEEGKLPSNSSKNDLGDEVIGESDKVTAPKPRRGGRPKKALQPNTDSVVDL